MLPFYQRFLVKSLYFQLGDIVDNPSPGGTGYPFNNDLTSVNTSYFHMIDGNLLYDSGTFEHVINTEWGDGSSGNLWAVAERAEPFFRGDQCASLLFSLVGAGVALPVFQSSYPTTVTPMGTVTLYFNGPFGYRGM